MNKYRSRPNFFLRLASVITQDNKDVLEKLFNETATWPIDFHELILLRDVPTKEQLALKNDYEIKESKKEKKGLAAFLKGKKFTYTLPGKKQINIFGSIVIGLNMILVLLVILYLKNQEFHDFVFNVGR